MKLTHSISTYTASPVKLFAFPDGADRTIFIGDANGPWTSCPFSIIVTSDNMIAVFARACAAFNAEMQRATDPLETMIAEAAE